MENINTSAPTLQEKKSGLLKDKKKMALIVAIMYLLGTIISETISSISSIISQIEYCNNASTYVSGPEAWLPSVLGIVFAFFIHLIPYSLFFFYLLAFYKKNPAHGLAKTSYIFNILSGIFGFAISLITDLIIFRQEIAFGNFDWLANEITGYLIQIFNLVATFIFCITFFSKFKLLKAARIFSIATAAVYIIRTTVNIIQYPEAYLDISILYIILNLLYYAGMIIFWFVCIDKDTHSQIPEKKKKAPTVPYPVAQPMYQPPVQPVAQPVYQAPVQPVAQPMYQAPVQPVAQPVYQPPVQPVQNTAPAAAPSVSDAGVTLTKLKTLLDDGLITQEDFDKKKAEILEKM